MATRKTAAKPNVSAEELKQHYHNMLLIRRFEEKAGQLYGMGLIGGFCHLYIGQEAVVVGLEAAAEEGDKRVTKEEFVATVPQYLDHEPERLGKAFDAMDANGGGFVLFDEFARYIIAHMEA